ncbi:MAG: trimethylamine methyltransferase family protein, partial [Desulfobulbaceae bacterium]|nr:trimethylamine methyltransferase family protein [Desulfobulbaceae bacterium]
MNDFRNGTIVKPHERLNQEQINRLHSTSMAILADPGIWCYNQRAADLFKQHGATVWQEETPASPCWRVQFPPELITDSLKKAPSRIILGARDPANRLEIDAEVPRVYFGSGSETNIWLDTEMEEYVSRSDDSVIRKLPVFTKKRGSAELLCRAAHL